MTPAQARQAYVDGKILINYQNNYSHPMVFQLFGNHYTSNMNRARKRQMYQFNNPYWELAKLNGFMSKLYYVCTDKVTKIG